MPLRGLVQSWNCAQRPDHCLRECHAYPEPGNGLRPDALPFAGFHGCFRFSLLSRSGFGQRPAQRRDEPRPSPQSLPEGVGAFADPFLKKSGRYRRHESVNCDRPALRRPLGIGNRGRYGGVQGYRKFNRIKNHPPCFGSSGGHTPVEAFGFKRAPKGLRGGVGG